MSEWQEGQFSDIATVIMGQSPEGETCNNDSVGTPLLNGPTEFGSRCPLPIQYTTDPKKLSSVGDILFCVRGSTTGRMNWADQVYAIGRGIAAIRHKEGREYQHFVKGIIDYCLPTLLIAATGSTFPNVSRDQLNNLAITIPPLPLQGTISEVFSSIDDKIDLLMRQTVTLETLAQTYFRQWFLEENDNDPIPVSDIATLENNSINPGRQPLEPFYHYSIPAYDNAQTPAVELGKTILSNKFIVLPNTILVSKLNPVTPRIWRIDGNVMPNSVCSTEFQVLKPKDIRHYLFLYCLMKSNDVVSSFAMSATGTSGSHQRIRPEYILEVETPEPDKDKLALFNEVCTPMMERVKKNHKQIQILQKLRDTLLPKLISGEVRVKQ